MWKPRILQQREYSWHEEERWREIDRFLIDLTKITKLNVMRTLDAWHHKISLEIANIIKTTDALTMAMLCRSHCNMHAGKCQRSQMDSFTVAIYDATFEHSYYNVFDFLSISFYRARAGRRCAKVKCGSQTAPIQMSIKSI